ncbi:MAG: hypothetical protein Q8P68_05570 [Candidatus Peregrinibacteria bacterium]|nr:hypothetical protein [Candidatus Peregrinibacteria bacterium]MDZ4245019.1 hypothetical protein [Candidatus Gracilibacteria bacterium]
MTTLSLNLDTQPFIQEAIKQIMPQSTEHVSTFFETPNRKLAYNDQFRRMLKEQRGLIKTALRLIKEAEDAYNPENLTLKDKYECKWNHESYDWDIIREEDKLLDTPRKLWDAMKETRGAYLKPDKPHIDRATELEVQLLGKSHRTWWDDEATTIRRLDIVSYARLTYKGTSFFVKKSTATHNPGYIEFHNTILAREALARLPYVRTIEPQFGYQDKGQSWFVSSWENLESTGFKPYIWHLGSGFDDYGELYGDPRVLSCLADAKELNPEEEERADNNYKEMNEKFWEIEAALEASGTQFGDLDDNIFYNRETKTFIYLDVTRKPAVTIGYTHPTLR